MSTNPDSKGRMVLSNYTGKKDWNDWNDISSDEEDSDDVPRQTPSYVEKPSA